MNILLKSMLSGIGGTAFVIGIIFVIFTGITFIDWANDCNCIWHSISDGIFFIIFFGVFVMIAFFGGMCTWAFIEEWEKSKGLKK